MTSMDRRNANASRPAHERLEARLAPSGNPVSAEVGAVVVGSTIGSGVQIGRRAYLADSTIAPGTAVPDGAILIHDEIVGVAQS